MCFASFLNSVSGISRGKQTSSWPVEAISWRMNSSMRLITAQPYGVQTFIPLIGYLLSEMLALSMASMYHSPKSSLFFILRAKRGGGLIDFLARSR